MRAMTATGFLLLSRTLFTMIPDLPCLELLEQGAVLLPQDTLHTPHFMECSYHWSMEAPLLVCLYLYFPYLFSSAPRKASILSV